MNNIMRLFFGLVLFLGLLGISSNKAQAQTIELLAGNTLNGAVNGTILGGATMALNGNIDFAPLRIGLGAGTLYGIGVGAYDVSSGGGESLVVSGTFNDGNNTSIIVLLDTFYGAAGGAIIASSVMLIAEEPLVDGLKYGSAIGAWAGFGVGIIDAFILSERTTPGTLAEVKPDNSASGIVGIQFNEQTSIGLFNPSLVQTLHSDAQGLNRKISSSVELLNLKVNF